MKRNRKYLNNANNTSGSMVTTAAADTAAKTEHNSILIIHWLVLKHVFVWLLAITGFLIFISIYFLSIYGESNFAFVKTNGELEAGRPFIPKTQTARMSKIGQEFWSSEDYETTLSKKAKQSPLSEEENGAWWHWFLVRPSENEPKINAQTLSDGRINHPAGKLNATAIIGKQVHQLGVNKKKRKQIIKFRFESLLNKIQSKQLLRYKLKFQCSHLGQIHFSIKSYLAKLANDSDDEDEDNEDDVDGNRTINKSENSYRFTANILQFWTNLTQILSNLEPCDIVVIQDYKRFLTTMAKNGNDNQNISSLINNVDELRANIFRIDFNELNPVLQKPEIRTKLFDQVRKYPALRQQPLSPLTFLLPQNLQQFLDVSDAFGYSTNWTLEYDATGSKNNRITEPLQIFSQTDRSRLIQINRLALRHQSSNANKLSSIIIKQHLIKQVVQHRERPVKLRIFTLITSLNPLRVFQYEPGFVFAYTQNSTKQDELIDSMENFWINLSKRYTAEQLTKVKQSVHQLLLNVMLLLEISPRLLNFQSSTMTSNSYPPSIFTFQWLAFDIVIQHTESFQAFIIDILSIERLLNEIDTNNHNSNNNNLPNSLHCKETLLKQRKLLRQLSIDTYRLLSLHNRAGPNNAERKQQQLEMAVGFVKEKLMPLLMEKDYFGLLGINCHISHRVCLSESDLAYLIDTVYQMKLMEANRLSPIYPFYWSDMDPPELINIGALFEQILLHIDNDNDSKHGNHFEYQTERLQTVVKALFTMSSPGHLPVDHNNNNNNNNRINRINYDLNHDLTNLNLTEPLTIFTNESSRSLLNKCMNDPEKLLQLRMLKIVYPNNLLLMPDFQPHITHYTVNESVNYEHMQAQIQVEVAHCDAWIQFDNRLINVQSGRLNFSLGLGNNMIKLSMAYNKDGSMKNEKILSNIAYTVFIRRQSREEQYSNRQANLRASVGEKYDICQLIQDCQMPIYPSLPCGWLSTNKTFNRQLVIAENWTEYLEEPKRICPNGYQNGRWLVPCQHCHQANTCLWSELKWLPYGCRYEIPVNDDQLGKCLWNKNILLIGDSTNRGIMHYIMERLNRTLTQVDKTHDQKSYQLMDYGTTINFVYYPKFWIPHSKRQSFDQVFNQSIQKFLNNGGVKGADVHNIVIIGGVQWISRQHLLIARNQLKSIGLDGRTRLLVKTIGSGFHQSVIGVHHMPLNEQIKLASQNQLLIDEALLLNIEPIDTFNKTISMFKDFYPGKCACHFHKITKKSNGNNFHVEGRVNQLYSEILLSRICSK